MQTRKSPRLKGYNYASVGMYFVTICTHAQAFLFGAIVEAEMQLSDMGQIAAECWREIPDHFAGVGIDLFVVMPNHVHGIIEIKPPSIEEKSLRDDAQSPIVGVGMPNHVHGIIEIKPPSIEEKSLRDDAQSPIVSRDATCCVPTNEPPKPHVEAGSLGAIVRSYKSAVTRQIRQATQQPDFIVWHGRYHDHIIRNEADLNRIREYIQNNPAHWQEDRYYAT